MTKYTFINDSKEFQQKSFFLMALLNNNNEIHFTINPNMDNNLNIEAIIKEMELAFDSGKCCKLEEFKAFFVRKEEAQAKGLIQ